MNYDVKTAHLGQAELLPIHTGEADLDSSKKGLTGENTLSHTSAITSFPIHRYFLTWGGKKTSYLLPGASAVGLTSSIHCSLVFPEVDQGGSQPSEVGDVVVQQLSGFVHLLIVTSVANLYRKQKRKKRDLPHKHPQYCLVYITCFFDHVCCVCVNVRHILAGCEHCWVH